MKIEEMVQELWDREKIKELTYQYGLAIEAQDVERMANLFTEDGSVDFSSLGRGVIKGHAASQRILSWDVAAQSETVLHQPRNSD